MIGAVFAENRYAIGPMADAMLNSINVGKAFLSVAGITDRGYFNSNMMLVESERQCTARSAVWLRTAVSLAESAIRLCGLRSTRASG